MSLLKVFVCFHSGDKHSDNCHELLIWDFLISINHTLLLTRESLNAEMNCSIVNTYSNCCDDYHRLLLVNKCSSLAAHCAAIQGYCRPAVWMQTSVNRLAGHLPLQTSFNVILLSFMQFSGLHILTIHSLHALMVMDVMAILDFKWCLWAVFKLFPRTRKKKEFGA